MSRLTLYEATEALDTVHQWIDEHEDEILANAGEPPPALVELLDQAVGDFERRVEAVALYIREREVHAEAVKLERLRLEQREKVARNAAAGLKRYLEACLALANVPRVEGTLATVRRQKNSTPTLASCPPVEALPAAFVRQPPAPPPEVDRAALVAAWKAGAPLPEGVILTVGYHLRIS